MHENHVDSVSGTRPTLDSGFGVDANGNCPHALRYAFDDCVPIDGTGGGSPFGRDGIDRVSAGPLSGGVCRREDRGEREKEGNTAEYRGARRDAPMDSSWWVSAVHKGVIYGVPKFVGGAVIEKFVKYAPRSW